MVHGAVDLRVDELQPCSRAWREPSSIAYGGICGSDLHYYHRGAVGDFRFVSRWCSATRSSARSRRRRGRPPPSARRSPSTPRRPCGRCPECLRRAQLCRDTAPPRQRPPLPHVQGGFAQLLGARPGRCRCRTGSPWSGRPSPSRSPSHCTPWPVPATSRAAGARHRLGADRLPRGHRAPRGRCSRVVVATWSTRPSRSPGGRRHRVVRADRPDDPAGLTSRASSSRPRVGGRARPCLSVSVAAAPSSASACCRRVTRPSPATCW